MGWRLNPFGAGYCGVYAIFGVVAVGWLALRGMDHMIHYTRTPAVVVAIGEQCRPKGIGNDANYALKQDPNWNDDQWGDCSAVASYIAGKSMTVTTMKVAILNYVSPADNRQHQGEIGVNRLGGGDALPVGTTVQIYAHDKQAETIDPA